MIRKVAVNCNRKQRNMEAFPTFLKGYFLIAMPSLMDPNFRRSVTCISEHTKQGAVGIVINQVHEGLNGQMIFEEFDIPFEDAAKSIPIHIGGPVSASELFVLHGPPLDWDGSLTVTDSLALSNSLGILKAIAQGNGPQSYLLSLGCAGWAPGQLEWELSQNAWLVCPGSHDILFDTPVEARWERAIKTLGIDPHLLSDSAGHA